MKSTGYEIFIGILSVLSIVNLVLLLTFVDDASIQIVLMVMNGLFSVIFLGDFIYRLSTAPSRSAYFFRHFGWADLLASLPFAQLKVLRVFRLVRVYRLLRQLGPRTIWRTLTRDRAGSALLILLLMGILVLEFGSISILYIEKDAPGANITSGSDAIWYVIVTISTVGYGDQYPVTNLGRLIGALIIIVGVGIFGTFTGYLANLFLSPRSDDGEGEDAEPLVQSPPVASVHASSAEVEELRSLLLTSQSELAEIKRLLSPGGGGGPNRAD
ncbi:potassium channel family protein [Microbacterium rhizomatis]|uniref:potassium channel family protein n=1 Tax=Microbacterium rhizomatis TaxID=1631477 RepID=UPI001FE7CF30|nr:potassium channel family protein [Microbacterium rhizomatis]